MGKDLNPVAAARKAEKAKALKKAKAQQAAQRTEKLARRNPERLQRQIDELRAAAETGELRPHDRQTLQQLERDVAAIRKAREALGDRAPQFGGPSRDDGRRDGREGRGERPGGGGGGGGRGGGVLGKRNRDGSRREDDSESSETDEDVRDIPMPRDTPPPIPRKRDNRKGPAEDSVRTGPHPLPPKPEKPVQAQTVYEAAPVLRDLRKEAARFVPAAVQQKKDMLKGKGRLLEPEELDRLEKSGYNDAAKAAEAAVEEAEYKIMNAAAVADAEGKDPDEVYAQFERELREVEMEDTEGGGLEPMAPPPKHVQLEEVPDEGD